MSMDEKQTILIVDDSLLICEQIKAALKEESIIICEAHSLSLIHISSVQQADAITQIRKSVELISEIVQGNSATSEESAAASEELSAQAQLLKELVEKFEL